MEASGSEGAYIVDFLCDEGAIVIEVDGNVHLLQTDYDERRTTYLRACGLRVLRFRNEEVLHERERVCLTILGWLGGARPGWE
jgi:very-short-patch-repair endonuclease